MLKYVRFRGTPNDNVRVSQALTCLLSFLTCTRVGYPTHGHISRPLAVFCAVHILRACQGAELPRIIKEDMARGGAGSQAAASGSFYGREDFKPGVIASQVALIQVVFYLTNAMLLVTLDYVLGVPAFSLHGHSNAPVFIDQLLDHAALSLRTSPGVIAVVSFVVATVVACPVAFVALVGRSKSALDFSVTLCIAHLACCALYAGFPTTPLWWIVVGTCGAVMTVVCELLSRRVEMRAIAVPVDDSAMDQP
jgi:Integral membrane protein S linking to the trans Golgi network